ncbi:nitrogen regulatory protein P-II family [Williamsia limnetica]|uniref:Nitrogen regulatory protein P-II family n=1 Tax=Williamsia limnetica TaxID=882452 RepID=A0A318RVY6_WILLI|nr:P-II family nitrogen regulator [Williamsia limnetica]PYE17364.1 nitrogen regulatory protein P-II family [Williamsia limnetica]
MKLVVAVIRPYTLEAVKAELDSVGISGMTITETEGYGRQRGHTDVFPGAEYVIDMVPKVRVEVLVRNGQVDTVLSILVDTARTNRAGDGKIWVTPVTDLRSVRTGEQEQDGDPTEIPANSAAHLENPT